MAAAVPLPLLKRLFEAAGYHVELRAEALLAVRSEDHRAVVVDRGRRTPSSLEPLFPDDSVRRTLLYEEEPGASVRSEAAGRGIEVLESSALGPALGEMLLPAPREPPAPMGSEGAEDALDAPFPVLPAEARVVRARIDRAEAEALAGLREARYLLRLVPYYVAAYRVRTGGPDGSPGPIAHRLVAVNAVTRAVEIWEEGERELAGEPDAAVPRLSPLVGEAAAASLAVEVVRRHHAGRIDHTEQHSGALVIESRRVLPSLRNVRMGPLALLYVPFWYAEGSAGRVVLDAVSGRLVEPGDAGDGRAVPE